MLIAVYPGSFDPVTNGHIDIIKRASTIFDHLVIAVGKHAEKNNLFSTAERVILLRDATRDIENVEVDSFHGLLSDYVRTRGARIIVRGLRAVTDFDYELQMALTIKKLAPTVETVFMMTNNKYIYLSSSIIKEVAGYGGCINGLVPENVEKALKSKFGVG
ncbi:MAG: pantetheine-phosphate adenylyltransferase [Firmicutes bacterium]|nr:pantetheine-phosphate adenylyltransferase [Bacillota bacterium]